MHDDLIWTSAIELRRRIGAGELSPVTLVESCLARIDLLDPVIRAFVHVDREGALAAAAQAERAVQAGAALGPLHGIPVAIKDDLWVRDMPATAGSLLFARFVPSLDGTVVSRLRAAGAIIIGKTNLPEFASWPRTRSWVGGETRNPWDLARIPGASSGGSAAAVAAGMVPLAIGTDGGGSVRIPAALCGIVGMLPTRGRVPDLGAFQCSPNSSAGPLARSVADLALLLEVISGPLAEVQGSLAEPAPPLLAALDAGVAGLRIGWSADFGGVPVTAGVQASTARAVALLGGAGASVIPVGMTIPHPWGGGGMMAAAAAAAAALTEADPAPPPCGELPPTTAMEAELLASTMDGSGFFTTAAVRGLLRSHAQLLSPPHRLMATHLRVDPTAPGADELAAAMARALADCDLLCSPTMADVAPVIPASWGSPYPDNYFGTNFTFIANSTGHPAISVPCGLVDELPAGLQIVGRPGQEVAVLQAARALEALLPALPRPYAI